MEKDTKKGYVKIFAWFMAALCMTVVFAGIHTKETKAATKVNVTLDASFEGNANKSGKFSDGSSTKTVSVDSGTLTEDLEAPTQKYLMFRGWYTQSVGGTKVTSVTSSRTLYAHWERRTFTVQYKSIPSAGVSNLPAAQTGKTYSENKVSATVPKRDGWTFYGWNRNGNLLNCTDLGGVHVLKPGEVTENMNTQGKTLTLYAVWKKDIDVRYNGNGGGDALNIPSSMTFTMFEADTSLTARPAFTVSKQTPTRSGYRFLGWENALTSADMTGTVTHKSGDVVMRSDLSSMKMRSTDSSIGMYAVWKKGTAGTTVNESTVTLTLYARNDGSTTSSAPYYFKDANGNTSTKKTVKVKKGSTFGELWNTVTNIPMYTGDNVGWLDFKGFSEVKGEGIGANVKKMLTTVDSDDTLYAVYEYHSYVLSYKNMYGTASNMPSSQTKVANVDLKLASNVPTKTGWTFYGWNSSGYEVGREDIERVNVCKPGSYYDVAYNGKVGYLYAIWKKNVSLSYDLNNGTGSVPSKKTDWYTEADTKINQGHAVFSIVDTTPTREGYTFVGWSATANGNTFNWSSGDPLTVKEVEALGSDITLHAVWKKNSLEVRFHANGGVGSMSNATVTLGSTIPKNTFTRKRYTFAGWNVKAATRKVLFEDEGTLISSDDIVDLYAVWKKNDVAFSITNMIHDEGLFLGTIQLKGGEGTVYSDKETGIDRAWIDGASGENGYFTQTKNGRQDTILYIP